MKTPHTAQPQPAKSKRGRKPKLAGLDLLDEPTRNRVLTIAASNAESPEDTLKRLVASAVAVEDSPSKPQLRVTFNMSRAAVAVMKRFRELHWANPEAIEFGAVAETLMQISLTDPRSLSKRFDEALIYRDAEAVCGGDYFARKAKAALDLWNAELDPAAGAEAEE